MSTGRQARQDYPKPKHAAIGKFNSIGSATEQEHNLLIMKQHLADIRMTGTTTLPAADLIFLEDVEMKLGQKGNPMFGWRQVENMVRIWEATCGMANGGKGKVAGKGR